MSTESERSLCKQHRSRRRLTIRAGGKSKTTRQRKNARPSTPFIIGTSRYRVDSECRPEQATLVRACSVGRTGGSWTIVTIARPKKVTISGLTLAGIYQFQIRALGVLGYTDWMDTKTFVVA